MPPSPIDPSASLPPGIASAALQRTTPRAPTPRPIKTRETAPTEPMQRTPSQRPADPPARLPDLAIPAALSATPAVIARAEPEGSPKQARAEPRRDEQPTDIRAQDPLGPQKQPAEPPPSAVPTLVEAAPEHAKHEHAKPEGGGPASENRPPEGDNGLVSPAPRPAEPARATSLPPQERALKVAAEEPVRASAVDPSEGILGRVRSGEAGNSRKTPYGSAGRVRIQPVVASLQIGQSPILGRSTRGGTPLGAPPKAGVPVGQTKPRLPRPEGFETPLPPPAAEVAHAQATHAPEVARSAPAPTAFPGTPAPHDLRALVPLEGDTDLFSREMFGTPAPGNLARPEKIEEAVVIFEEDEETNAETPRAYAPSAESAARKLPQLRTSADTWLVEALTNAETLLKTFPPEAGIELSKEPNLPFSLVVSRAQPAVAVGAMLHFIEFLSSIATPPRARIEIVAVQNLDRSFHKNVEAALEPYFGENFEVRPAPGQVDIRFTDPDPLWSAYPRIPVTK